LPGGLIQIRTAPFGKAAITFTAADNLKSAPIPVNKIHIRYIQNVTDWFGVQEYSPSLERLAVLKDDEETFLLGLSGAGRRYAGALANLDRASGRLEQASRSVSTGTAALDLWLEQQWWRMYYGQDRGMER
jgi:hypothetical protein